MGNKRRFRISRRKFLILLGLGAGGAVLGGTEYLASIPGPNAPNFLAGRTGSQTLQTLTRASFTVAPPKEILEYVDGVYHTNQSLPILSNLPSFNDWKNWVMYAMNSPYPSSYEVFPGGFPSKKTLVGDPPGTGGDVITHRTSLMPHNLPVWEWIPIGSTPVNMRSNNDHHWQDNVDLPYFAPDHSWGDHWVRSEFDEPKLAVGLSGWMISPRYSGGDVPFTHPFGFDWEFMVAPDAKYRPLLAPTNRGIVPATNCYPNIKGSCPMDPTEFDTYMVTAKSYLPTFPSGGGIETEQDPVPRGILGVEIDRGLVPLEFGNWVGDNWGKGMRVAVYGRWIVDNGHEDFHTEVHPPLLIACARPRPSGGTLMRLVSRPFLVSQQFNDQDFTSSKPDFLNKIYIEILRVEWARSVNVDILPTIFSPFEGHHRILLMIRPPYPKQDPTDQLLVTYHFTLRPGIEVSCFKNDDYSIGLDVSMDEGAYVPPPQPTPTLKTWTIDDLKKAFKDVDDVGPKLDELNQLNALLDHARTYSYGPQRARSAHDSENVLYPTFADDLAQRQNLGYSVGQDQPFPIYGWLHVRWKNTLLDLPKFSTDFDDNYGAVTFLDEDQLQEIYVFVRGVDGHLYMNYWDGFEWMWADQGTPPNATCASGPAVVSFVERDGTRKIYAFVGGSDGHLYINYWGGEKWQWADQGTPPNARLLATGPAAITVYTPYEGGTWLMYVFVQGSDGHLYVNFGSGPPAMSGWRWADQGTPQNTSVASGPGAITYEEAGINRIYAFVEGNDGYLHVNYWDGSGWQWANQGAPPNATVSNTSPHNNGPRVISYLDRAKVQRIYAFVRGANLHLYVNYWDGSSWRWADQGMPNTEGTIIGPGVIAPFAGGGIPLIGEASDHLIYVFTHSRGLAVNYWDGSQWRWADQGTPPNTSVMSGNGVITFQDPESGKLKIYAFVVGYDGHLYVNYWDGSQWRWADQNQ